MLLIYRFLKGYLRLAIYGDFPERLINKCAGEGINLWDIKYSKGKIHFSILLSDFIKLFKIRKGYKISVKIKRKRGFPFIIRRYKFRYGMLIGFVLFCAVLYVMGSFIWKIEVNGNQKVTSDSIIEDCRKIGVDIGTQKKKINAKICREKLLVANDKLAWAALNIEGCVLTVDVTETKNLREDDEMKPSNLRAIVGGKIEKISVTEGNCVVSVGETVEKGQLLVSGIVESKADTKFVHSIGEIYASTNRKFTYNLDYLQEQVEYSDNYKHKKVLEIFGLKIPLYLGKTGENYLGGETTQKYLINSNVPIKIYNKTFTVFRKNKQKKSREFLLKKAEDMLSSKLKSIGVTDYKITKKEVKEHKKGISVCFFVLAQENIAYQDILLYNKEK